MDISEILVEIQWRFSGAGISVSELYLVGVRLARCA